MGVGLEEMKRGFISGCPLFTVPFIQSKVGSLLEP